MMMKISVARKCRFIFRCALNGTELSSNRFGEMSDARLLHATCHHRAKPLSRMLFEPINTLYPYVHTEKHHILELCRPGELNSVHREVLKYSHIGNEPFA